MDAFLLVGQSNMAGRGELPPKRRHSLPNNKLLKNQSIIINGHEILSFGINNEWIPAHEPIHYDKPSKCGIGPGLSFAKLIAELDIIHKNRKIGVIPCAIGGSSINQWLPKKHKSNNDDMEDGIFEKTIKKTKLALDSFKNKYDKQQDDDDDIVTLRAILWHQGESDCCSQEIANNHLNSSLLLFENFRKELNDDNIPIIVGGLADFLGKHINDKRFIYYNIINTNLMSLPQRIHNVAFVSSKNLNDKGDLLHFNSESAKILGHRYALQFAKLSGSLTKDEINKYRKFQILLKKHGNTAIEKTKGISFKTWFIMISITAVSIYAYKKYYDKKK